MRISIKDTQRQGDRQALYDSSASAWGLRLAVVVGLLAVLMAALVLVLVVTTAWRTRSRDYAALRMAGVPVSALRRASALEQGVVVLVAGAAGILCGLLASRLALPMVPLFPRPSATYVADLRPAWTAVAADLDPDLGGARPTRSHRLCRVALETPGLDSHG